MRTERDFIGEKQIPISALWGIQSLRAAENFMNTEKFNPKWFAAMGLVKKACFLTYAKLKTVAEKQFGKGNTPISFFNEEVIEAMLSSAQEIADGKHFEHFIVPAMQGGAGTSINMNINEIIANAALLKLGKNTGDYNIIDPIEQANIYQSTNDVVPTALKVATIKRLQILEKKINHLREQVERLEQKHRYTLRIAYTQMQEAVPSTYGKLFSTYCDALSRDWWRVSKCFERIKEVNLGGSAIGTSLTVPRFFVMEVVNQLREITQLPIARSENLCDTTANVDAFAEVHAILKSHAVNLEKITSDIRLLASDINTNKEFRIPQKQIGSTIMPRKVNPVIVEYTVSVAHQVYANDAIVSSLAAQGNFELNAYLPSIGNALLQSIDLLISANETLLDNLFTGIEIDGDIAQQNLMHSAAITTALIPFIGYNAASELGKQMQQQKQSIYEANEALQLINDELLQEALKPENLLKAGFSLNDVPPPKSP